MNDQFLDVRQVQHLLQKVYRTIPNVENWADVVREILSISGASKGIMALRSDGSADFRVPSGVLQSPLIVNFEPSFIASFVEKYIAFDPWTPIELAHHPDLPYALSDHVSLQDIKSSKFWEWLAPQDIDDTVVLDVGRTDRFWVGLNIYFQQSNERVKSNVIEILKVISADLRTAWQMGETYRIMTHQSGVHLKEVSNMPLAAFFCKSDGTVNMVTDQLRDLTQRRKLLSSVEPRIRFGLSEHQTAFESMIEQAQDMGETLVRRLELGGPTMHLSVSKVTAHEDAIGRKTEQFLGIIGSPHDERRQYIENIVNRSPMTSRERGLYNHLCDRGTVRGFADVAGISPHTADFHWRSLKEKLGLSAPKELWRIFDEG